MTGVNQSGDVAACNIMEHDLFGGGSVMAHPCRAAGTSMS